MSPRARRSESITLPPGNHPGLIRYNDEKSLSEKEASLSEKDKESANKPRRPSAHRIPSMESSLYDDLPSDSEPDVRRNDFGYNSSEYDNEESESDFSEAED